MGMNIFRGHDFYFVSRIKINILSICPMTATVLIKQKQQNNYACFSKWMNKTICNWFFFFTLQYKHIIKMLLLRSLGCYPWSNAHLFLWIILTLTNISLFEKHIIYLERYRFEIKQLNFFVHVYRNMQRLWFSKIWN